MLWNGEYPLVPILHVGSDTWKFQTLRVLRKTSKLQAPNVWFQPHWDSPSLMLSLQEGDRKAMTSSLSLVSDDVTVLACFASCFIKKSTRIYCSLLLPSLVGCFPTWRNFPCMGAAILNYKLGSRLAEICGCHLGFWKQYKHCFFGVGHLEFLIQLLIGWTKIAPTWIWKTIGFIVLQRIAYCLYRLLISYSSFKRRLLLPFRKHKLSLKTDE